MILNIPIVASTSHATRRGLEMQRRRWERSGSSLLASMLVALNPRIRRSITKICELPSKIQERKRGNDTRSRHEEVNGCEVIESERSEYTCIGQDGGTELALTREYASKSRSGERSANTIIY